MYSWLYAVVFCELWNKYQIVISYLQHSIRARGVMFDDDENLEATFCGTNLPLNAVCCCYHPSRTNDGATTNVSIITPHWHLKFKYALSLNRHELNDCICLKFSPNQWIKFHRMFRKYLREKTHINGINLVQILRQRASDCHSLCDKCGRLVNWEQKRWPNWRV